MPVINTPLPGQSGHHAVQFYSEDRHLCGSVADFLGDGLAAGQPVIVIATPKHRDAILAELKSRHFDVDTLIERRDLMLLDAAQTLEKLCANGRFDASLFDTAFEPVIDLIYSDRPDSVVRAYGEIVDLLWRAGEHDDALALEETWTDVARRHSLSVLCGYGLAHFYRDTAGLQRLCDIHTHNEIVRAGNA
jgi:hypothetical protein